MADKTPESSTVRSALALIGAVEDLIQPGRTGATLDPEVAIDAATTIMRTARELRPHQVDDVVHHLDTRAEEGAFDPPAGLNIPIPTVQVSNDGADRGDRDDLARQLGEQVDRLAEFIIVNVPGEPSVSEGAIDTAIRVLRRHYGGTVPPLDGDGADEPNPWVEPTPDQPLAAQGPRRHEPGHDPSDTPDPLDDGKTERATRAVDELAARVNEGGGTA